METLTATNQSISLKGDFLETLMEDKEALDLHIVDATTHKSTLRKLLAVSMSGLALHGLVMGLIAQLASPHYRSEFTLGELPMITLPLLFPAAFLLAIAVCLPSFYFYTQLSGLDASLRLITGQALRVQARSSVMIFGALPVFAAIELASVVGLIEEFDQVLMTGYALPFVVGLFGLASLYRSFHRLSLTLPVAHKRRPRFLPRMVLAWGGLYLVVCVTALTRLNQLFGTIF